MLNHPILSFDYIILLYLNTFFYIALTLILSYNYRFFNHLSHHILNQIYGHTNYINCYCIFLFLLLQHVSMDYEIILLQYLNRKTKLVIILFYCLFIKLLVIVQQIDLVIHIRTYLMVVQMISLFAIKLLLLYLQPQIYDNIFIFV